MVSDPDDESGLIVKKADGSECPIRIGESDAVI
jgi:hypothetical protein